MTHDPGFGVVAAPPGRGGWFTGRVHDDAGPALADEVADVLAHLLLLARSQGVDVEAAVRRKWLAWEADLT
ncbi:hypothetical protein [Cellulosimicrobium sp. CUA-896]|uniref:hypothetical protein n=1 Tax=Cellulosimicrobium sp. CUA-896 TaxID=1517881 RepID=UPI00095E995C|nr:hypothetical protein [Cellulosimicrobium sp. CUA-896]OLT52092.1 hypothetical protein BJF88_14420 [Cellulosimicrobium sp. CUA-896]